jgi:hypothetical protein
MAAAIPLAFMVGGTLLQQQAAKQQGDEQRAELNKALERTSLTQKKANTAIGQEAAKLAPAARMATMQSQAAANDASSTADLQAAGATDGGGNAIIDTSGDHGAVSKDFLAAKADRALTEGSRLTQIARQLAAARAPGQLQEQEGLDRADLGERLGDWWGTTKSLNDANATAAQNIEAPAYGTLGGIASQLGAAYASKGMGAKKAPSGAPQINPDQAEFMQNFAGILNDTSDDLWGGKGRGRAGFRYNPATGNIDSNYDQGWANYDKKWSGF